MSITKMKVHHKMYDE